MTLIARQHITRSKAIHLRVRQELFSTEMKDRLQRVGTPAVWYAATSEWDWPISPAAVIKLHEIAQETSETIDWRDGLLEFAEAHIKQNDAEHQVRLAIERIIQEKPPLEAYVTRLAKDDGEPLLPLYHQQVGYHWSQRVGGLLLAWDPGTGKGRAATDASGGWYRNQQIRPMESIIKDGKPAVRGGVLVVAPPDMLKVWMVEARLWQSATGVIIRGDVVRKTRLAGTPAHYHIINYQNLKYVQHNEYDGLIVDEIQACANATTQTEHVRTIAQRTRKRLGLSATPIANKLESIFYPMLIVDGGKSLGASKTAFLEKFFNTEYIPGIPQPKYEAKDGAEQMIAAAMAESTYFVTKKEVLPYLPLKTHAPRYLEMTAEQARYYKQMKTETEIFIQDATVTIEQASARMMKLLQICQGFVLADGTAGGRHFTDAKTDVLMRLLTENLADRKVMVWAYFTYEIDRLVAQLKHYAIPHIRMDGEVPQKQRDAAKDRWNNEDDLRVCIRQMSMSAGVTMHANESRVPCYDMIYMGLSYKYIDWVQSQDRIHRIGQNYPCSYTYLLTEDGLDRHVYDVCLDKYTTVERVHGMGKNFFLQLLRAS
jgi:SWI/SNF-related matrix-associated actin-dependent regulator of chromatin subfamily A-like protein 1